MSAGTSTVFRQMHTFAQNSRDYSSSDFSLPALTIAEMEWHGINAELIEKLFGSREQIEAWCKANTNLTPDLTDRALRVLRIVTLAEKVFGDPDKAMSWLNRDNKLLGSKPLDLLAREAGANLVQEALLRIEYGVFA